MLLYWYWYLWFWILILITNIAQILSLFFSLIRNGLYEIFMSKSTAERLSKNKLGYLQLLYQEAVPCCGSRSGIRCLLDPWIWDPEAGRGFSGFRIPNPRSLTLTFESSVTNFLLKSAIILCQLAQYFFLYLFKHKILSIQEICGCKKSKTTHFFPFLFCCYCWISDPGSETWDPGSGIDKSQDPGAGINIPDPQHCPEDVKFTYLVFVMWTNMKHEGRAMKQFLYVCAWKNGQNEN